MASFGGAALYIAVPVPESSLRAVQGGLGSFPTGDSGKVYEVTFYAPDGSDPPGTGNLAANTTTVFIGPDGANFPLAPGARKTWYWCNPGDFKVASPNGSGQYLFMTFGGSVPKG